MKNKNKISISQLRYFIVIIWFLIFLIIVFSGWFLYNNFYKVIIDSGEVLILEGNDAVEKVNIEKIKTAIERHKEKIEPREVNINLNFQ